MAHLWTRAEAQPADPEWSVCSLSGTRIPLLPARAQGAVLHRLATRCGGSGWALIVRGDARVSVSGHPVRAGLRLLADRDSIAVAHQPLLYFSTERLAEVVALPAANEPVFCARCKSLIATGKPAVGCAGCGAWHCCDDERPCWLYAETCAHCDQPTALDAGYRWSPESL